MIPGHLSQQHICKAHILVFIAIESIDVGSWLQATFWLDAFLLPTGTYCQFEAFCSRLFGVCSEDDTILLLEFSERPSLM